MMKSDQPKAVERMHHWDFSRALYLALGIPFHAALIYSMSHEWSVSSTDKSLFLTWLADFIHTFRMPGFFMLAGMFSIMLLDRQGALPWLKSRLLRLGLPLLFATLLILPFQILVHAIVLRSTGALPKADFYAYLTGMLTQFGEPWISHLWFLWVLIAYCVALACLHALLGGGNLRAKVEGVVAWCGKNLILASVIFVTICIVAAYIQSVIVAASPYYGNAVINYNAYAIYFGFGVLVHYSKTIHDLLLKPNLTAFFIGCVLVLASITPIANLFGHTLQVMAAILGALLIIGYISNRAQQHFGVANPQIRKLVDASFTIYLFHHPVIYLLAALFLTVNLPPVLEFLIITPAAGLITYAIHQSMSGHAVFMLMFNGVTPKPNRVSSVRITKQLERSHL